jgi:hypothetical protein
MATEVRVIREERYAPHIEEYLERLLPTETVLKSGAMNRKTIPAGTFVPLASYKLGAGSPLRITHLGLEAGSAAVFQLRWGAGTLYYYLEAAGGVTLLGEPEAPVHVIPVAAGTYFRVGPFGTYGACTGTIRYFVRFEGVAVQRRVYGSAPNMPT